MISMRMKIKRDKSVNARYLICSDLQVPFQFDAAIVNLKKLVKAFKLGDTRISDNIKVYYEKANSKNEEPNYETLGKIRNESNF